MSSILVISETQHPFWLALGLKVAVLTMPAVKDHPGLCVLDMEMLELALGTLRKSGDLTDAEVSEHMAEGSRIGLLPTWEDVARAALAFKLPDGNTSRVSFKLCPCEKPLPHGYLVVDGEDSGEINTVDGVLGHFDDLMKVGFAVADLARAFQKAIAANLPSCDAALAERFHTLTGEQKLMMLQPESTKPPPFLN